MNVKVKQVTFEQRRKTGCGYVTVRFHEDGSMQANAAKNGNCPNHNAFVIQQVVNLCRKNGSHLKGIKEAIEGAYCQKGDKSCANVIAGIIGEFLAGEYDES